MPTGPTGRRDESVQFSLQELLKIEDERLEEQARAKAAREAAEARKRDEAERRRLEESEANARAEAEARERQRRGELEDIARREAMQKAIVEQGRLEVEVRARAEERDRERRHELEIERLRTTNKTGPSIGALAGAAAMGGGILFVIALAIELAVLKPAEERRFIELQRKISVAEGRVDDVGKQLDEQRRVVAERDRQLADARTEIDALKRDRKTPATPPAHGKLSPMVAPAPKTPEAPDCHPLDPMCFSLKTGR
jgi:hypothetical protein